MKNLFLPMAVSALALSVQTVSSQEVMQNPTKNAYFGNLHVHTSYSFDGYTNGSPTGPDDAYRWAKGEAIPGGGNGTPLQINVPLDWYSVSDHAMFLGVFKKMEDPNSPFSKLPIAKRITSDDTLEAFTAYAEVLADVSAGTADPALTNPEFSQTIWGEIVETADAHNKPGSFTTFPAFEWTSHPGDRNLHRVVLFKTSDNIPIVPFSVIDSDKPEDLWTWMDQTRAGGATLLAVPHNGNASDGAMFPTEVSQAGNPLDADYARTRMRNEPLFELLQIKGSSDTHPELSPKDEFADFELWDYTLSASAERPTNRVGSYMREALIRGMAMEAQGNGNPFKYGFIGDSDTHNSASTIEEDNYTGKFGFENDPKHRLEGPPGFEEANKQQVREFASGGVAGVWAESNTREAIYGGLVSKESFATSGPRMRVRVFAGYEFGANSMTGADWLKTAYATGVPMGGDLRPDPGGKSPTLLIASIKEADGANLDRVQVIKGWVGADGKQHEEIYNVAMSDGRTANADGSVADVGNTVNSAEATYSNSIGAMELSTVWTDPEFDPTRPTVYYVRVLQIPTPRWSTYDSARLGIAPRSDIPVWIRERAWSSPIWYTPAS